MSTFGVHKASSASKRASSTFANALGFKPDQPDLSGHAAFVVAESWGVQRELWDRTWTNLSGGEAHRIVLAIAVGMGTAEVLLLDGECSVSLIPRQSTVGGVDVEPKCSGVLP